MRAGPEWTFLSISTIVFPLSVSCQFHMSAPTVSYQFQISFIYSFRSVSGRVSYTCFMHLVSDQVSDTCVAIVSDQGVEGCFRSLFQVSVHQRVVQPSATAD